MGQFGWRRNRNLWQHRWNGLNGLTRIFYLYSLFLTKKSVSIRLIRSIRVPVNHKKGPLSIKHVFCEKRRSFVALNAFELSVENTFLTPFNTNFSEFYELHEFLYRNKPQHFGLSL
jgi:hypothetical protein